MTASITKISNKAPAIKVANKVVDKARSRQFVKKMARQAHAAAGIGAVALTLTSLSLSHLSHGIEMVTGAPSWESWAMATGIDLGFIALEMATICAATDTVRKQVARYSKPAIIGTLTASALLNSLAFAAGVDNLASKAAAVALGVAIPALIYALTRIGAALYLNCDRG